MFLSNGSVKVVKIRHSFVKLHQTVFKQNATFQFSVEHISYKMHDATLKLFITRRQYVDRSY